MFTDSGNKAFTSGEVIAANLRVKISAGTVLIAGATDPSIGATTRAALVSGDPVDVALRSKPGTLQLTASGVITAGNPVYAAAAGKVAGAGTVYEGIAMNTTTADGDIVEVVPAPNTDLSTAISGTTADSFTVDSDSAAAKLKDYTNGATGNFTLTRVPPNMTANATITYPAVTGTLSTLAGTETLTNKTITSGAIVTPVITLTANAATANGSAQAAAGALAVSAVNTATGDGTAGVVLPAAAAGKMVIVYNLHANLGLKVYPAVGDDINDGATDAAVTIEGKTMAIFVALDDTTWAAIYTANT